MAQEIIVKEENPAVIHVNDATGAAAEALARAQVLMDEVEANHVKLVLDPNTNEFYALWGVD